ncbi:hypothetical protein CHCC20375_3877 [Bacillus licheniformis]|nr:hypothetical protein CHCC20375_3877 [Bacillus licheniformis]
MIKYKPFHIHYDVISIEVNAGKEKQKPLRLLFLIMQAQ